MNYINPEDFNWSNQLNQENIFNYNENCIVFNNFCGSTTECQNIKFDNADFLNQESTERNNSVNEKYYPNLGESELKFSDKASYGELKSFERNYSENALTCLYRNAEQSIDLKNFGKQETVGNPLNFDIESLSNRESSGLIAYKSDELKESCFYDKNSLDAETISLIRNGISGIYDHSEPFSFLNTTTKEHEQVVPISNYTTLNENLNPQASFSFSNHYENNSENIDTNHFPCATKEDFHPISITNEVSTEDEFLGNKSLYFKEITAFTPGGQSYKLNKQSNFYSKTKVAVDKNQSEVAALLNNCKKFRQIQVGIFIPQGLDYNKEEAFTDWLREEKNKTKSLFENFNIKLNFKYLTAENELIKLDRYLKQHTISSFLDPLQIFELIEKTEIDLNNLVSVHQVYETVSKISKNCKGHLRVKSKALLLKLKSLISPPKRIKAEKYFNDLLVKNNINNLKTESPAESIVHLLMF